MTDQPPQVPKTEVDIPTSERLIVEYHGTNGNIRHE